MSFSFLPYEIQLTIAVANTQRQYYAVLEGGLGLVSVCLPSIWYFVAGMTPGKVLYNIKRVVSLEHLRSRSSKSTEKEASWRESPITPRRSSEAWIVSEMADVERQESVLKEPDRIHVETSYDVRTLER